jgi:hypothetical protein
LAGAAGTGQEVKRMSDFDRSRNASDTSAMSGKATSTQRPTEYRRFQDYADTYRSDWERRYGTDVGRSWEENEEGYRYGWYAGQNSRFQGRDYRDVESDLQRDWPNRTTEYQDFDTRSGGQSFVERKWDDLKDAVQQGFERARMEFQQRF